MIALTPTMPSAPYMVFQACGGTRPWLHEQQPGPSSLQGMPRLDREFDPVQETVGITVKISFTDMTLPLGLCRHVHLQYSIGKYEDNTGYPVGVVCIFNLGVMFSQTSS